MEGIEGSRDRGIKKGTEGGRDGELASIRRKRRQVEINRPKALDDQSPERERAGHEEADHSECRDTVPAMSRYMALWSSLRSICLV